MGASCLNHADLEKGSFMRILLICGALLSFLGVAAGAFGAHGLRPILSENMMGAYETGVRYHLVHALAMLVAGLSAHSFNHPVFIRAGWSFFVGIGIFSGSLYVMSLSGIRSLGMLTPLGGIAFLIGWVWLAWGFWSSTEMKNSEGSLS